MKAIKLYVVAFLAMLFGASFSNRAVAQSGNEFLEQLKELYMSQNENEMREAGIVSFDVKIDGTVFVYDMLLDENIASVEAMGDMMNLAKKKAVAGDILSYEDYELIEMMEPQGLTFRYIVRGNRTGKRIVCNFTVRELLAFEKLFSGDDLFGEEMSVDDIVVLLDNIFAAEDETMGCVRRGNVVYLEMEVPANDYDDIKYVMEDSPELIKNIFQEMMASDPDAVEVFRSITKKGYRLAYSVKCGSKQPIVLELDF